MTDRLFDMESIPEVPLFREPRARKGAARGSSLDARFTNDYPPEWSRCTTCGGVGTAGVEPYAVVCAGASVVHGGVAYEGGQRIPGSAADDWATLLGIEGSGQIEIVRPERVTCPDCLGMGSLKARVRLEAGHRCVRCQHPYVPKGDAKMLGVKASGVHECPDCEGWGRITDPEAESSRCRCKGSGVVWTPWSACDSRCTHGGPIRARDPNWNEVDADGFRGVGDGWVEDTATHIDREPGVYLRDGHEVEAIWRILTVHHLDGDKANVRWWNLASLCQRCHLEIQSKVVMERVYPHEHSEWFKPYAAGYYAFVYLGEELTREQTMGRLNELLALELAA